MYFTDDPVADAERYMAEQEAELKKLPRCCECDEPIQQTDAYYINDEWMCDRCMDGYRREVIPEW